MKSPAKESFIVTLEAVPDSLGRSPAYRLKGFLKVALRSYGLRCTRLAPGSPDAPGAPGNTSDTNHHPTATTPPVSKPGPKQTH